MFSLSRSVTFKRLKSRMLGRFILRLFLLMTRFLEHKQPSEILISLIKLLPHVFHYLLVLKETFVHFQHLLMVMRSRPFILLINLINFIYNMGPRIYRGVIILNDTINILGVTQNSVLNLISKVFKPLHYFVNPVLILLHHFFPMFLVRSEDL